MMLGFSLMNMFLLFFLLMGQSPYATEIERMEALISKYGKEALIQELLHLRGNFITLYVRGKEVEFVGPPDPKYVTPRTLLIDLIKANLTLKDLEEALRKRKRESVPKVGDVGPALRPRQTPFFRPPSGKRASRAINQVKKVECSTVVDEVVSLREEGEKILFDIVSARDGLSSKDPELLCGDLEDHLHRIKHLLEMARNAGCKLAQQEAIFAERLLRGYLKEARCKAGAP